MPILKTNPYSTIIMNLVISIVMFEIRIMRGIQVAKGTKKLFNNCVFVKFILSETATVQGLPVEPIGMSNLQN